MLLFAGHGTDSEPSYCYKAVVVVTDEDVGGARYREAPLKYGGATS